MISGKDMLLIRLTVLNIEIASLGARLAQTTSYPFNKQLIIESKILAGQIEILQKSYDELEKIFNMKED
jgi:hypothetical protein